MKAYIKKCNFIHKTKGLIILSPYEGKYIFQVLLFKIANNSSFDDNILFIISNILNRHSL
jgi:hypothetical protein